MSGFFTWLQSFTSSNGSIIVSLITFGLLYHKMSIGFNDVKNHLKRHGSDIKQINGQIKNITSQIKRIKKQLRRLKGDVWAVKQELWSKK